MQFQMSCHINADQARTFALFTDFKNAAANIRGIKHIEVITDGPVGVGTRFRETRTMFGKDAVETMEVTAMDPPRSYSVGCGSCGARFDTTFHFTPDNDGTRVDVNMNAVPTSLFAKIMSPVMGLMMAGTMRKCFENDLADLKAVAEGRPVARTA